MISTSIEERYNDPDFWTAKIQLELYRLIKEYLEETTISQNELARRLGVSKGYLSQVLNGNFDHKLSKLVSLALAVGRVPNVEFRQVDQMVKRAKGEYDPLTVAFVSKSQTVNLRPSSEGVLRFPAQTTDIIFKEIA
jgi:transcriptional regulator with XRE-family HTH domain